LMLNPISLTAVKNKLNSFALKMLHLNSISFLIWSFDMRVMLHSLTP